MCRYLTALSTVAAWEVKHHATYMYTVPMFHCNGWTHAWMAPIVGMKLVLMNNAGITGQKLWDLINTHKATPQFFSVVVVGSLLYFVFKSSIVVTTESPGGAAKNAFWRQGPPLADSS